jgi:Tfp pilus assembly protein PilE
MLFGGGPPAPQRNRRIPSREPRGLTLLQLLIAIVAGGALIGVVISHVVDARRRAYRAELEGELTRLAAAQNAYLAAHGRYATDAVSAGAPPPSRVTVEIGGAGLATGAGWTATAEHSSLPGLRCRIGVGSDTLAGGVALKPGAVRCAAEERAPE